MMRYFCFSSEAVCGILVPEDMARHACQQNPLYFGILATEGRNLHTSVNPAEEDSFYERGINANRNHAEL